MPSAETTYLSPRRTEIQQTEAFAFGQYSTTRSSVRQGVLLFNALERTCIKLKVLKSGDIFYVDSITHDAVKISPRLNMKQVSKREGQPIPDSILQSAPSFNKNRRTCFTDSRDSDYQLYFNGMNNLSMINVETFEVNEISNFFTWNS